jgi:hypothetical protein
MPNSISKPAQSTISPIDTSLNQTTPLSLLLTRTIRLCPTHNPQPKRFNRPNETPRTVSREKKNPYPPLFFLVPYKRNSVGGVYVPAILVEEDAVFDDGAYFSLCLARCRRGAGWCCRPSLVRRWSSPFRMLSACRRLVWRWARFWLLFRRRGWLGWRRGLGFWVLVGEEKGGGRGREREMGVHIIMSLKIVSISKSLRSGKPRKFLFDDICC